MSKAQELSESLHNKLCEIAAFRERLLCQAAKEGDIESMEAALQGVDDTINLVNQVCGKVAAHGSLEGMQWLINRGADVNFKYKYGDKPLSWAVRSNSPEVVQLLLSNGAKGGITELHSAVSRGQTMVETLLNHSTTIDVNARAADGATPLWLAAEKGDVEVMRILVEAGADAKIATKDDYSPAHMASITPLHVAAQCNRVEAVRYLVEEYDIDINAQNGVKETALHNAVSNNYSECIKLLLLNGADPSLITRISPNRNMDVPVTEADCIHTLQECFNDLEIYCAILAHGHALPEIEGITYGDFTDREDYDLVSMGPTIIKHDLYEKFPNLHEQLPTLGSKLENVLMQEGAITQIITSPKHDVDMVQKLLTWWSAHDVDIEGVIDGVLLFEEDTPLLENLGALQKYCDDLSAMGHFVTNNEELSQRIQDTLKDVFVDLAMRYTLDFDDLSQRSNYIQLIKYMITNEYVDVNDSFGHVNILALLAPSHLMPAELQYAIAEKFDVTAVVNSMATAQGKANANVDEAFTYCHHGLFCQLALLIGAAEDMVDNGAGVGEEDIIDLTHDATHVRAGAGGGFYTDGTADIPGAGVVGGMSTSVAHAAEVCHLGGLEFHDDIGA